jgi:CRISPR-associated protein Cas1
MPDGSQIHRAVNCLEGDSWQTRSEHWIAETHRTAKKRRIRERQKEPLILCGHGLSLRVDGGTLLIRNGLTHYPQQREEFRFFKGDPAIPPRIIMLDGSGCISFEGIDWLAVQRVPLVRIDWKGEVVSVLTCSGYSADREKVRWQVETRADPARRIEFATNLITEKIAGSIETLQSVIPPSRQKETAIPRLRRELDGLLGQHPEAVTQLLGIEGRAAFAYFSAWEGVPLRWKATARRPIPDSWQRIGPRASLRSGKAKNVRASHPVNAMLNYAYAVLQSQVQIEAVAAGYDPTLGIMHHGYQGSPALVFDLMEPRRPKIDAAALSFALSHTFSGADFVIRSDGVVRLAPQLAKRVCQLASACQEATRPTAWFDQSCVPACRSREGVPRHQG